MSKKSIYLDNAAATPMDDSVERSMQPYFSDMFYNPSASYLEAKQVAHHMNEARHNIAMMLGVRPAEIVFTAGGSEANNLAISGVMQSFPDKHIVVSAVEHDSVLKPAQRYNYSIAPVQIDGRIQLEELRKLITDNTVLVSVMYANNELGTVMPLRSVAKIIEEVKKDRIKRNIGLPIYFHTDACQAPLYLDVHANRLGADLVTLNGSKMYGPKQTGMLYVKTGVQVSPIIRGGGQEWNLRSGTENVPGIIGFNTALTNAVNNQGKSNNELKVLQNYFIEGIKQISGNAVINGSIAYRLPNNVHVTFPGVDNERLMMELDEQGIMCAVGSACSASNDEPSHVLKAIGLSDADAQASLRFSMSKHTTKADINYTLKILKKLITP